jgi:PPK2 family polyphosphate:nucleotide phosphotransferase
MANAERELVESLLVHPGKPARLDERDPANKLGLGTKSDNVARLDGLIARLQTLQNRLWAEDKQSLLLVLQGLDASGKDGTIRHVFTGVNPQGCRVVSFKEPTLAELDHDYLWRIHTNCPERGEIGIFNRSHYEDLVTVQVRGLVPRDVADRRPAQVRAFERMLSEEGTTVLKVFLHVSRDEQRDRLQARLDDPEKAWKFRVGDLDDRKLWDDYHRLYEHVLTETSTEWAPWHVVPGDHKWVRNIAVASLIVEALERMDPKLPPEDPALRGLRVT